MQEFVCQTLFVLANDLQASVLDRLCAILLTTALYLAALRVSPT